MFEVGVGFFKECGPQRILGLCTGQYLLQKKAIARRLAALCLLAFRPSIELRGAKSDSLTTRRLLALKDSFHIKEKLSTLCSGLGWFLTGIFGSHERYFISALEAKLNPPAFRAIIQALFEAAAENNQNNHPLLNFDSRCSILTVCWFLMLLFCSWHYSLPSLFRSTLVLSSQLAAFNHMQLLEAADPTYKEALTATLRNSMHHIYHTLMYDSFTRFLSQRNW